ncbi:MAG: hypothetical protein ACAH20_21415 [Methylobacteriaceae bacterium]
MTDILDFLPLPACTTVADYQARLREQRHRERRIIAAFVGAAAAGDLSIFNRALNRATEFSVLGRCLCALIRSGQVHDAVRAEFHVTIKTAGDGLRQELRRDLDLMKALRLLLPPHQGSETIVFRGDSAFNRRRRTYGLSWTTERDVADSFAQGEWRNCDGGSVLLQAVAPPAAILWTCPAEDDLYGEAEVMVDRRYLRDIRVLQRFSQASEAA